MRRLIVTDHALLRFLARAGGMDVEAVRQGLAASLDRAGDAAASIDAREYQIIADGLIYVVRNRHVVTILFDERK